MPTVTAAQPSREDCNLRLTRQWGRKDSVFEAEVLGAIENGGGLHGQQRLVLRYLLRHDNRLPPNPRPILNLLHG
jgi:hypothetical protein